MKKKYLIFAALLFSSVLHLVIVCLFSLHIDAKSTPVLQSLGSIINKNDLFFEQKKVVFPLGFGIPSTRTRKEYFTEYQPAPVSLLKKKQEDPDFIFSGGANPGGNAKQIAKKVTKHLYLWRRNDAFASDAQAAIPYRVYVSSQGKVLLLYPEKLALNSYDSISLQDYIKKSSFFLNDKFFWTKIDGVVK